VAELILLCAKKTFGHKWWQCSLLPNYFGTCFVLLLTDLHYQAGGPKVSKNHGQSAADPDAKQKTAELGNSEFACKKPR